MHTGPSIKQNWTQLFCDQQYLATGLIQYSSLSPYLAVVRKKSPSLGLLGLSFGMVRPTKCLNQSLYLLWFSIVNLHPPEIKLTH